VFTVAEAAQVVAQCLGRRVALVGLLGEQLGDDRLVGPRHVGDELVERRGCVVHLLIGDAHRVVTGERRLPGDHLVQHDTDRVQVATRVGLRALSLLGGEVGGGAHYVADLGEVALGGRVHRTGDAEVGHLHLAVGADEHVGRLDVAVYHAVAVGVAERSGDLAGDLGGLNGIDVPVRLQNVGERAATHVFHRHEVGVRVLAPVVHADDVGMVEVGRGLRLAAETLDEVRVDGELGEQHLDGHRPVEQLVARQEHVGHAAAPDALFEFVAVVENDRLTVVAHVVLTAAFLHRPPQRKPTALLRIVATLGAGFVTATIEWVVIRCCWRSGSRGSLSRSGRRSCHRSWR
jgi:hypothetical protein